MQKKFNISNIFFNSIILSHLIFFYSIDNIKYLHILGYFLQIKINVNLKKETYTHINAKFN